MKVLFSSNRNPNFRTITEYIEAAIQKSHEVCFFDNRDFIVPGRIRDRLPFMERWDLERINKKLLSLAERFKPDVFIEAGGHRILPAAIEHMKSRGIKTVLWTIDAPKGFNPVIRSAPYYDCVFTGGSEAYDILSSSDIKNLHWLPFACDPALHRPVHPADREKEKYGNDIAFVGSYYPSRFRELEEISDFDIGIWGPGWENVPPYSPLKKRIRRAGNVPFEEWIKIFSSCKIVIATHFNEEGVPCFQASPKVYEALACNCFLIVDDQKDVSKLFDSGKHLAIFKDSGDLREKLNYYLSRSGERERVAMQGYKEVLEKHTYVHRVQNLIEITEAA